MKLDQLHIENFGVYCGRTFDFGDGLQVIYGPNEAGKSTLLHLLRHALFGFPHRNPYGAAKSDKPVAVGVRARMADGRRLKYRRQKGHPQDHVAGEIERDPAEIDAARLSSLMRGAHDELFRQIFAFSIEELAAGQRSLDEAGLSEALFGGGIGGLETFLKVRETVEESHKGLFNSRGKKGEINQLLTQVAEATIRYKTATLKPRDFDQLRDSIEEHDASVERIRSGLDLLRRRLHRLERLKDAIPHWRQETTLREEIARRNVPAGLGRPDAAELRRLQQRLSSLDEEMRLYAADLDRAQGPTTEGESFREIVGEAAAIRTLSEELGQYRAAQQELQRIERDGLASPTAIEARIRDLHPTWTLDDLDRLSATSLAQVRAAEALQDELRDLSGEGERLASKRSELETQIETKRRRLESLPAEDRGAALQSLLERGQEYKTRVRLRSDRSATAAEARQKGERLLRQLRSALPDLDESARPLEELTPPLTTVVSGFQQRLAEIEQERERARTRLVDLAAEQARLAEQLHSFDHLSSIPDDSALRHQRHHRDEGWGIVRARLRDEEGGEVSDEGETWRVLPIDDLIREYEDAVRKADVGADRRFEAAETIARREQIASAALRLQGAHAQATEALAGLETLRQQLIREWEGLWANAPFRPLPPAAMLEWLTLWDQMRQLLLESSRLEREAAEMQSQNELFEKDLFRAFPRAAPSAEAAMAEAREAWQQETRLRSERESLERDRTEGEANLETLDTRQYELSMRQADADSRRRALADQLGLPAGWDLPTIVSVLRSVREIQEELRQVRQAADRTARLREIIDRFESSARSLCRKVAADLAPFPPREAVEELIRRLDSAREAELESARRLTTLATADQMLARCRASRDATSAELAAALAARQLASDTPVMPLVEEIEAVERLSEKCSEARQHWRVMAGDDAEFHSALASLDEDQVAAERLRIEEQLAREEEAYRHQLSQVGRLRSEWDKLQGDDNGSTLVRQLEDFRSRLQGAVDRWAPLVLVQTLMTESLRRFEQEHQPQILVDTARLLSRFTGGEYIDLQRKLDDKGTLLVVPARGEPKRPAQLSTGTREQLYLAVRLAYIQDYSRRAEPLPIVMDDVLVNFDEDRARRTLETLVEFSRENQILFLTCHRGIVETLQQMEPQIRPLELIPGSLARPAAAEESATTSSTSSEATRGPKRRPRRPSEPDHPALFPSS